MVSGGGPTVLGFFPKMWVGDEIAMMPVVERMLDYDANQEIIPWLAESWDAAADGKSITIKLRKGIKFTDGSEFNAEVARWNYQLGKDTKRLQTPDKLLSIDVLDNYTLRLNTTEYNPLIDRFWGWYPMFSKEAYDKNGEDWCISHCVATGPFMVGEYKRDDYIKFVKNPNYWQSGKPYLDAILVKIIPDPTTASAVMQAGEADFWGFTPPQNQKELEAKGLIRQINPKYGGPVGIIPNNKDTDSRFKDKRLREAIEYAIDKAAIAKALGFGYSVPMTCVYPAGTWGYIPEETRPYNPEKAKQLIAEAGYPNGLKVKLLAAVGSQDMTTAIKQYLDAVGMEVDIDMADMGRYYGMAFTTGWPDLILYGWGVDPNTFVSVHCHWGPEPLSNPASLYRPPEFVDLAHESLTKRSTEDLIAYTGKMIKYIKDEAMVIPLTYTPSAVMIQPWVHTTYLKEMMVTRHAEHEWVDKH
jgi:peptide/nickel transport system substrate-binding protein